MSQNKLENQQPLEQLRQIRIEKLDKLRELGINPYPAKAKRTNFTKKILDDFKKLEGEKAVLVGRLMSWREHGSLVFSDLQDQSGQVQLYIKEDTLKKTSKKEQRIGFKNLDLFDIGDFVQVTGKVTKTKRGEISLEAEEIKILTKSLRPLPSKHFGLKDEEERYRQRYVDLNLNPELRDLFIKKSKFWNSMRQFMLDKDFLEVETPVLENTTGGADANPFTTHHDALDIDVYLRISMGELWQKRLMVGGFEKTFEIGRQFRNEGISREHLQDYTQMEFYWSFANYKDSMKLVEKLYKHVAKETFGTLKFEIGDHKVDLGQDWKEIDFVESIKETVGIDVSQSTEKELQKKLEELNIEHSKADQKGRLMDLLWKEVRKGVSGPAFLVGHPVEVSPLAKRKQSNSDFVERYQVILAGSEMGNGYSELNDPVDQAKRFTKQQKMREAGDEEAQMFDYDFVRALEYGMPPVTGFGVSERLFSFLANKSIRETVLFPLLRPEEDIDIVDASNL